MTDKYVLDDAGEAVPFRGPLEEWSLRAFGDKGGRVVGQDTINGVRISTVFLGLDHSHGYGPPQLFETMIFGGRHNESQWRYSTRAKALAGHQRAITLVQDCP